MQAANLQINFATFFENNETKSFHSYRSTDALGKKKISLNCEADINNMTW